MSLDWVHFTPGASLLGGAMIGAAAALLLLSSGRIAGISGILGGVLRLSRADMCWRLAFLAGLLSAPWIARLLIGPLQIRLDASWPVLVLAGVLVGFGTRLGNGCTSGHGVCGLASLSLRSAVAVAIFMATAIATVFLFHFGVSWLR